MLTKLKGFIKSKPLIGAFLVRTYRLAKAILIIPAQFRLYQKTKKQICFKSEKQRVFYLGIPAHRNLGDLAQGVCIRKWIKKNYPNAEVLEIETNAIVNTPFSVRRFLKAAYRENDIILFQSGYTTTDLGGYADEMHCAVIDLLPNARFLMMPQTIFFKSESRKERTSIVYSKASNMLFLARDRISFECAEEMFASLKVLLYPDIVTTLIGKFNYKNDRDGILFCVRDDSEKFYSDDEIKGLMERCSTFATVEKTDTTKKVRRSQIVKNAERFLMEEIEKYSTYKLIITDRYHGTILSLVAGTPVVIIKTTDHKVTTGAEWFNGVYDDYVFLANSLEEAFALSEQLYNKSFQHVLEPYFENEYYDKLRGLFEENLAKKKKTTGG